MSREDLSLVQRRELAELLYYLGEKDSQGALLLGEAGVGKTTLLRMVEEELKRQGRAVFFVKERAPYDPVEVGTMVLDTVASSPFNDVHDIGRTLLTSAGGPPLREVAEILRDIGGQMSSPVLLLDGFNTFEDSDRKAAELEELSLTLRNWKFVVSSRTTGALIRRLSHFRVIQLRGFSYDETITLLRKHAPDLSDENISLIADRSEGNPLFINEMVRLLQDAPSDLSIPASVVALIKQRVNKAISSSSGPAKLGMLLEDLALAGGRDEISALALKSGITEDEVWRLFDAPDARGLIVLDDSSRTATISHALVREAILSQRILLPPGFRLADLKFGAEEAERDELLDESFVQRRGMGAIFDQHRSIVVGDRGSGKSAIFRKLAAGTSSADAHPRSQICPVTNTGDLLHRIVAGDAWLDAEALRAAWLVVVASVIASTVPASAPRRLRRDAADLRAAFGLSTEATSLASHMLRTVLGLFGGTTLNFAVGPVNLQAKLPSGNGRPSRASVDVESFLQEADSLLRESARRVAVMFDRIDEIFKYDRAKQEAAVQSLLQAEGRVSLLECIDLVVFLRTDLFELYDIQEKNKLVSRTITLDWSEEEWLQILLRRVFANESFQRLAMRLRATDGAIETRSGLEILFPPEVEGQPIDRWLIDSLRNGNGDVSPRLAILLLYISRDMSANPEGEVSTPPLFPAEVVGKAMTKLSDLSFSEVVNDFKVAPTFVLSVRAGKLYDFSMHDVENLFNEAEGKISDQIRLLERLGFLERVVQESGSGAKSLFRIPKLYTRCWEHS